MRTKKILVVTDNLGTQINGVVTTFKNIEPYATKEGYEIVYLGPESFWFMGCPGYKEVKLSLPLGIGRKIRDIDPDYIHIATEGPIGFAANMYCWRNNYRFNTSYHTKFPEFIKKIYGVPESITYRYMKWFHGHSGKVLTTTQTMVDELLAKNFLANIIPWARGVNRDYLRPTQDRLKRHRNDKPSVLYVGRLSKEKNLDALCVLQNKYNISIVGDGPDMHRLSSKYKKVSFLGYKIGSDLANCYLNADVFAFPGKEDTFGIVMIESLSLGTPVAGYNVPGPKDIVENGLTGYVGDNLDQCIEKCMLLNRRRVRRASNKWTWSNCWEIFRDNLISVRT